MSEVLRMQGILSQGYGIVPKLVMKDKELTAEAKAVYAYLCSYAGSGESAFPSMELMSEDLGMSLKRLRKHRDLLTERGYIVITKETGAGFYKRNVYTLVSEVKLPSKVPDEVKVMEFTQFKNVNENIIEPAQQATASVTPETPVEQNPFAFFTDNIGVLTPHIAEQIEAFMDDFTDGEVIVIKALEIAVENQKRNFGYAKSILNNWYASNIRTSQDLAAHLVQQKGGTNYAKGQQSASTNAGRYTAPLPDSFNW